MDTVLYKSLRKALYSCVFLWACHFLASSMMAQESMRYRFEPSRKYTYDVKITAIIGDVREIREGTTSLSAEDATDQQITLKATGNLNVRRQSRDGSPVITMPNFRFGPPVGDFVNIRTSPFSIDKWGKLLDIEVQTSLPFMLGDFEQLLLDELPKSGKDTRWNKEREVSVVKQTRSSPFPRMGRPRGFGPPAGFGPPGFADEDESREQRSATERTSWEVVSREDGGIQVHKTYQLKTDDKVGGKPRRRMEGEGDQTFDPVLGVWKSALMQYEVEINDDNVAVVIPVSVSFRLLTEPEAAKREKAAIELKEKNEMAAAKAAEANRPKPLAKEERSQLLIDLKSGDDQTMQKAGDRLAKVPAPENPDKEIASALAAATGKLNGFPRAAVAKALAVWATADQEKDFIRLLSTNDFMVRPSAIQGLAKCPTTSSAKVLASQLKELSSRGEASKALKSMQASIVEPQVIPLLKDKDVFARGEAVKILQEIGTKKSLPSLKQLETSGLPFADRAAREAINAIELRESTK